MPVTDIAVALAAAFAAIPLLIEFRTPLAPGTTLFLVPDELAASQLARDGVARGRVWTVPEFDALEAATTPAARTALVQAKLQFAGVAAGPAQRPLALTADPAGCADPARISAPACPCPSATSHSPWCRLAPDYVAATVRDRKRPLEDLGW